MSNNNKHYLSKFLWVRSLGETWRGRSGLGTVMRVVLQYVDWATVNWRLVGLGWSASKVAHSHSWQAGTGYCWQDSLFLFQVDLSPGLLGCPHDMMVGFLRSERSQSTRRKPQCLYNLASKVIHHNVCMVVRHHWSHRSPWFTVQGEHRRAGIAGGGALWETFWRVVRPRKLNKYSPVEQSYCKK